MHDLLLSRLSSKMRGQDLQICQADFAFYVGLLDLVDKNKGRPGKFEFQKDIKHCMRYTCLGHTWGFVWQP